MTLTGRSVRSPGSTANLGPGFDVLGLAVNRYCFVSDYEPAQRISAGDPTVGPCEADHIAQIAYAAAGGQGPIWFDFDLPPARGLGFSAAARAAGAMLAFVQQGLDNEAAQRRTYDVVAELEGHGDNAAPSAFGGIQIVTDEQAFRVNAGLPGELVFWSPEATTSTEESRAEMATDIPIADAVFNIGRTALLIAGLYEGDLGAIGAGTHDRLHQDVRLAAQPASAAAMDAALGAGAAAAWLSGSGPTIAALCPAGQVGAVSAALPDSGDVLALMLDQDGSVPVTGTS